MKTTEVEVVQKAAEPVERVYPIYNIQVRWSQKITMEKDLSANWTKGLPEGRFWNGLTWYRMEREDQDMKVELLRDWWPKYCEKKNLPEPGDITIEVTLHGRDTWCPNWFAHWTFDTGESDESVLASFERYVDRIVRAVESDRALGILMGAEDRWRWCGSVDGSSSGERTPPPCRCRYCKEQGVMRINH